MRVVTIRGESGDAQYGKEPDAVVSTVPFPRRRLEAAPPSRPVFVVLERFKGEVVFNVADEKAKPVKVFHQRLTFDCGFDGGEQPSGTCAGTPSEQRVPKLPMYAV